MFTAKVQRRTYRDVSDLALKLKGPTRVKVGLPAGEAPGDLVAIGIYNEMGTRTIPERPAFRNAIRANRNGYQRAMSSGARDILNGGTSVRTILSRLGILAQGHIQQEITSLRSPPNAPSTIRQKGSSNPLINSGRLRASITWKIDD